MASNQRNNNEKNINKPYNDCKSTYLNPTNRDEESIIDSISYRKVVEEITSSFNEKAKSDAGRIIKKNQQLRRKV